MAAYTTIDNPELYFQTVLYTGNGSTQTISYPNADADLTADMIWIKQRSQETSHTIFDSVRGVQEAIFTNNINAETTRTDAVSAFGTDGFDLGANGDLNANTETHVAWCWKANGTGSANTEGNTDTTISANTTAGFSIIDGCDDLNDNDTFGHGLNSAPNLVIMKRVDDVSGWRVFYTGITDGSTLLLNSTAAVAGDSATVGPVSSTLITVEGSGTGGNEGDNENVAYAWHSVQGYSKIGTYKGNANADGTFVYTGFRPAFVLLKNSTGGNGWEMRDNKRPGYNLSSGTLAPSSSDAETTGEGIDIFSNGFKLRASGNGQNGDNTYMYMAFAEAPFVNSNGVPCNAR